MAKEKLQNLVRDDLRDVVRGDLSISEVTLAAFSGDAGIWEQKPLCMVSPRDENDAAAVLVYASGQGLSLHPRGAGLGVTGECLGAGIILDCSKHLRRLVEIGTDWIRIQAGATLMEVNAILAERGRRLQAVPAGYEEATIGGWISSLGRSTVPREGTVADQILNARVALTDGSVMDLGPRPIMGTQERPETDDLGDGMMDRLTRIAQWRVDLCEASSEPVLLDHAGMVLAGLIDNRLRTLNPHRLLAGSRGSLGVILEATLKTVEICRWSAWAVIGYDLLERAAEQCLDLPYSESLESAEMVDWRSIALACDCATELKSFFPEPTPVALVLCWGTEDEDSAESILRGLQSRFSSESVYIRTQVSSLRHHPLGKWRGAARMALGGRSGASLTRPVFESITVRPEAVSGLLSQIAAASQTARLNVAMSVAPKTGRIVVDPIFEPKQSIDEHQITNWLDSLADLTFRSNGVIRGVEPWLGRVRGSSLNRQFADLRPVWREIKTTFDTGGRLNPEALPGEPRSGLKLRVLAIPAGPNPMLGSADSKPRTALTMLSAETTIDSFPFLPVLEPDLNWPQERGPQLSASACNSCGACRSMEPSSRMCPSFRGDRSESSSPRALAGLIRQVTAGTIDPTLWGSEQIKEAAEACFHCQMCRSECQAGVDISGLMIEAKAAAVANHGLAPKDFWLSRVDILARMSSFFPVIANAILSHGQSRWLLEKVTGLSKHRRLPAVRRWSFIHKADSRGWCRPRPHLPGPRVALFLDILANHFDQDLAETTVEFLKWAGVNVYVPGRQRSSGMPALVVGDLDRARELVRANLRVLGNAVRDGFTIVCIEPTSAMVIRDFYPRLTDDLDARLVADNTLELSTYLAGMAERGLLPESRHRLNGRVGYHQPCHLRALNVGKPGFDLVKRVPGISLEFIDKGCSGIAGPFGFSRSNFRKSLRIGHQLRTRLKDDDIDVGMTECLSCRMQMEQGIPKRSHHPVEILAMAAGLKPELRVVWNQPKPRNIIT